MSDDKPRGIVDPWRRVDPLRTKPRAPAPDRKDLDDIDYDADLAIPGRYTIRSQHASFAITHVRIEIPKHALDVLADCVVELFADKAMRASLLRDGIGARGKAGTWNAPRTPATASTLQGTVGVIWFAQQSLDQGLLALVKVLRSPAAIATTRKWGVVPMLNG